MKLNRILPWLFSWIILCSFSSVWAQTEAEAAGGSLELQSKSGRQIVYVPAQTKIGVKFTVNSKRYMHKTLDEVRDTSVVISGDKVGTKYLSEIIVRNESRYKTGKAVLLISIGIIVAFWLLALLTFYVLYSGGVAYLALLILTVIFGIAAGAAFPTGVIIGIVLMAIANQVYRLGRDWTLKTHPGKTADKGE